MFGVGAGSLTNVTQPVTGATFARSDRGQHRLGFLQRHARALFAADALLQQLPRGDFQAQRHARRQGAQQANQVGIAITREASLITRLAQDLVHVGRYRASNVTQLA